MNNEASCIGVTAQVALEALEVARAGTIDIEMLLREEVNGHGWLVVRSKKIEQDKELAMIHSDLDDPAGHAGISLLVGKTDDGFWRSIEEPALDHVPAVFQICVQTLVRQGLILGGDARRDENPNGLECPEGTGEIPSARKKRCGGS